MEVLWASFASRDKVGRSVHRRDLVRAYIWPIFLRAVLFSFGHPWRQSRSHKQRTCAHVYDGSVRGIATTLRGLNGQSKFRDDPHFSPSMILQLLQDLVTSIACFVTFTFQSDTKNNGYLFKISTEKTNPRQWSLQSAQSISIIADI